MPTVKKLCRGAVSTMVIFIFTVLTVFLPLGLVGIQQLCDIILISRARNFQGQLLPAAYKCLDMAALAEGKPALQVAQAESMIRSRFNNIVPVSLKNRLRIVNITFDEQQIQPDPDHWMGSSQPLKLPVIKICTAYLDCRGHEIMLNSSIEMLTD
jgi:hypothetical protein